MADPKDTLVDDEPALEAPTQPTRVVDAKVKAPRRRDLTLPLPLPEESVDVATEIDVLRGADVTPTMETSVPSVSSVDPSPAVTPRGSSSPVLALAKPKPGETGAFRQRDLRLPTASEIRAAIEGTPTESVPVVDASAEEVLEPDEILE